MKRSKILSLNIGGPQELRWGENTVISSMHKKPVAGPLKVGLTSIEGDSFASPKFHGTPDNVLYAFGLSSIEMFTKALGLEQPYEPGTIGETLTVDHLDEKEVSVGDLFKIGSVFAEASWPRIPCAKVNFRMQHPEGQKQLFECGRSGVYFRIMQAGEIHQSDEIVLVEKSPHPFSIADVYAKVYRQSFTNEDLALILKNDAFPAREVARLQARLGGHV